MNYKYINLKFKPNPLKFVIGTFYLEPAKNITFEQAANEIAAESSIGTWTAITTLTKKIKNELGASVFYLKPQENIIKIAYPVNLFERGNIPQFLSNSAGNIFSVKLIKNLKLLDVQFPPIYIKSFPGPAIGANEIKKLFKAKNRPLIGAIIKPKLGLTPDKQAEIAYYCFKNGIDIVKDDENLTNQNFNQFEKRVISCLRAQKKAEKETKEIKAYVFNITAETEEMIKRAKFVKKHGGKIIMIDVITAGFSAVQTIRKKNLGLIIHAHRAMHSAITRNPKHGISMLVLAKLLRLAGVDQLHTGTVVGKMEGGKKEVLNTNKALTCKWFGLKPVLPIASGGLHPKLVPELIKILGKNLIINFGGGLHGHPHGTACGARAARQAVDAACQGISLKKYAKTHPELKVALDHF